MAFFEKEWSEDDIKVITGMIVHSSDLSGPTKSWELEYYFAVQVNKEFIKQVHPLLRLAPDYIPPLLE